MRPRAILLIYGEGGHSAQMKRFYGHIQPQLVSRKLEVVGICENDDALSGFPNLSSKSVRDKHSDIKSLVTVSLSILRSVALVGTARGALSNSGGDFHRPRYCCNTIVLVEVVGRSNNIYRVVV